MKKGLLLLTLLFLLAGCALPLPLKVASWALDGISYMATEKSIAENGLSIIAKKDCSLIRPLKGQPVCIGNNYDIAQVLKNAVASASVDDQGVQVQEAMAEFETAAGPPPGGLSYDPSEFSDAWRFMRQQAEQTAPEQSAAAVREVSQRAPIKVVEAATPPTVAISVPDGPPGYDAGEDTEAWAFLQARDGGLASVRRTGPGEETQQAGYEADDEYEAEDDSPFGAFPSDMTDTVDTADTADPTPLAVSVSAVRAPESGPDAQPSAGLYYVIGSLTRLINLDRLSQRQTDLESLVVVAKLQDRPIYREVVGPFKRSEKQAIRRMIENAGVTKVWLTFIDPHRWTLASPAEISVLPRGDTQTASLR